jgi:hypothetical protein
MKAEQARKMTDEALAKLAAALEQGKSDALTQYLNVMARFHSYSYGNVMLILAQRPDATHVAGFHTWRKLNRWVKKGERGIVIVAPMIFKKKEETQPEGDSETAVRFKAVFVFDVSQTEGDPLPEPADVAGDPGRYLDTLKAMIVERGITLSDEPAPLGAMGVSKGGEIRLAPGLEPAKQFEVLAHEFAHELLHQGAGSLRGDKTTMETEAEAVAYVVCHAIGLDTNTAASDYIQLHKGTKETLAQSLERIQKTANLILEGLEREEEEEQLAA